MTFAWWHVLVALIPILPNLWSIWHIWNHRFSSFQQKAIWLVIAVFLPVLGGLIYISPVASTPVKNLKRETKTL